MRVTSTLTLVCFNFYPIRLEDLSLNILDHRLAKSIGLMLPPPRRADACSGNSFHVAHYYTAT